MRIEQDEEAADEDSGWKLLHGDVFRFPSNPVRFTFSFAIIFFFFQTKSLCIYDFFFYELK